LGPAEQNGRCSWDVCSHTRGGPEWLWRRAICERREVRRTWAAALVSSFSSLSPSGRLCSSPDMSTKRSSLASGGAPVPALPRSGASPVTTSPNSSMSPPSKKLVLLTLPLFSLGSPLAISSPCNRKARGDGALRGGAPSPLSIPKLDCGTQHYQLGWRQDNGNRSNQESKFIL